MPLHFESKQNAILEIAQGDLPDSLTPYADMAKMIGTSEAEVLDLLRDLKTSGVIRRLGASIRHQRAGWKHNAMVAWISNEAEADICGPIAAKNPHVSHAYYRPSPAKDWPYTFYTMIHGRSDAECLDVINQLRNAWSLQDYIILRSIRELKKTSMRYFS